MGRKSKKMAGESVDTHEDDHAVDQLADAVADFWNEEVDASVDPFEIYVYQRYSKMSADRHEFRGRLRRGYRSLLTELRGDSSPESL